MVTKYTVGHKNVTLLFSYNSVKSRPIIIIAIHIIENLKIAYLLS